MGDQAAAQDLAAEDVVVGAGGLVRERDGAVALEPARMLPDGSRVIVRRK